MSTRVKITAKRPETKREDSVFKAKRTDFSQSANSSVDHILHLQRTIGNQAVQRLIKEVGSQPSAVGGQIQAKLKIGQPGDKYEQEADRVADKVMRMPEPQVQRQTEEEEEEELIQPKPIGDQITPLVQRQVEPEEEEEETVQTKEVPSQSLQITTGLESQINSLKGGGQPLPESVRTFFEPRFGRDFNKVRIHNNARATQATRTLNAKAFTVGGDVVFGAGQYSPNTPTGKRLLAHELTHVVQQNADKASSVARQLKQPEKIDVFKHGGHQFKLNFSFSPKKGDNSELSIEVINFLQKKRIYNVRHQVAISNSIRYCTEQAGLKYEIGQAYDYLIAVKFVKGQIDWLRIILTKPKVHTYDYEISSHGQKKEMSPAERMKKAVENIDELLAKFDKWAEWAESLSRDIETTTRISEMRKYLNQYRKPISNTLKCAEIATQAVRFVHHLENTMNHSPGTPKAAKAFSKLGKPVGDLLEAISKLTPPGVKQFLRALAKAAKGFPGLVEDVERAGDPLKRMRRRKDWWVLDRPGRR